MINIEKIHEAKLDKDEAEKYQIIKRFNNEGISKHSMH
jgi:hypothetical protein